MFTLYAIIVTALVIIIAFTDYSERFASNGQQTAVYGTPLQLKAFRKASMALGHATKAYNREYEATVYYPNHTTQWHSRAYTAQLLGHCLTVTKLREAKHQARLAQIEALLEYKGYYAQ